MKNQLSIVQSNTVVYGTNYTLWQTLYAYDGLGRLRLRVERQNMVAPPPGGGGEEESLVFGGEESLESGGGIAWGTNSVTEYIYDGWRVIQEREGSNVPTVSYTRGTDLSGSLEGAGGIGGLLARSHGYSAGNWSTNNFYHADGNGNVTYLVSSSQALAARYRYDPYGNLISSTETLGYLGTPNTYRFSSKMADLKTDLYYYGYRWYSPGLQRWVNRDPIEEQGGLNLYGFLGNDSIDRIDPDGLRDAGGYTRPITICFGGSNMTFVNLDPLQSTHFTFGSLSAGGGRHGNDYGAVFIYSQQLTPKPFPPLNLSRLPTFPVPPICSNCKRNVPSWN